MSPALRRLLALLCATTGMFLFDAYAARPVSEGTASLGLTGPSLSRSTTPGVVARTQLPVTVDSRLRANSPASVPVRVSIPGMTLAASVVPVGLNASGGMDVPPDPQVLGWYDGGSGPGSRAGSMVIAGHVNTRVDGPGVLARLGSVRTGTQIVLATKDGAAHTYRVTSSQQVHKRDLPLAAVFAANGAPVLRLITCTGRFLGPGLGYENNLVVTATAI